MKILKCFIASILTTIFIIGPNLYEGYTRHLATNELMQDIAIAMPSDLSIPEDNSFFITTIPMTLLILLMMFALELYFSYDSRFKNRREVTFARRVFVLSIPAWQFIVARYTDLYESLGYNTGNHPVWPYAIGLILFYLLIGGIFYIRNKALTTINP